MVVFTCNKCGESLKKKDVEKHCFTRCRGPPYLTCVDCLKDFCDDFVKHTMCISEDDRYSAMGLKGTHSKQKSKQQIWVETVHNSVGQAIDDNIPGLTASIRSLMLYLQEQPNLPDKAKAFFNFVKNARRAEPPANIEFVWNILEKARNDLQAKQKAEREAAEAEKRKAKESQMQQKMEESSDSSSEDSDSDQSAGDKNGDKNGAGAKTSGTKKESKTEMHRKDVVNGTEDKKKKRMMSESESVITVSSEFRKTKKKKRNPESESQDVGNTTNLNSAMDACHLNTFSSADMDQKMTKKEKKEKKKRGKYEAELKEIESAETADQSSNVEDQQNVNDEETDVKKGKKKKDKKKKSVEENGDVIAQDLTENNKEKKKVSKKKAKGKNGEVEEFQEYNVGQRNSKEKYEKSGNGKLNETLDLEQQEKVKFSMDTAILQVLESVDEISLKRLSKKVICEYLNSLDDDAHVDEAKIMTKFQKRLDKMHNVVVHKDKVKLRTSRD